MIVFLLAVAFAVLLAVAIVTILSVCLYCISTEPPTNDIREMEKVFEQ